MIRVRVAAALYAAGTSEIGPFARCAQRLAFGHHLTSIERSLYGTPTGVRRFAFFPFAERFPA